MAINTVGDAYEQLAVEAQARGSDAWPWLDTYLKDQLGRVVMPRGVDARRTDAPLSVRTRLDWIFAPRDGKHLSMNDLLFQTHPSLRNSLHGRHTELKPFAGLDPAAHQTARAARLLTSLQGQWSRYDAAVEEGYARFSVSKLLRENAEREGPRWQGIHFPTGQNVGGKIHP